MPFLDTKRANIIAKYKLGLRVGAGEKGKKLGETVGARLGAAYALWDVDNEDGKPNPQKMLDFTLATPKVQEEWDSRLVSTLTVILGLDKTSGAQLMLLTHAGAGSERYGKGLVSGGSLKHTTFPKCNRLTEDSEVKEVFSLSPMPSLSATIEFLAMDIMMTIELMDGPPPEEDETDASATDAILAELAKLTVPK